MPLEDDLPLWVYSIRLLKLSGWTDDQKAQLRDVQRDLLVLHVMWLHKWIQCKGDEAAAAIKRATQQLDDWLQSGSWENYFKGLLPSSVVKNGMKHEQRKAACLCWAETGSRRSSGP